MTSQVTSPPSVEPFTTAAAKAHLRVDLTDDDDIVDAAIVAARTYAENFMHRKLITQTVTITATGWGGRFFILPIAPVQSISEIRYTDSAGVEQTWSAAEYQLVKSAQPARIAPAYGLTWPVTRSDYDTVSIDVVCGYGDASTDIPKDIMQALRLLLAHFYENRQEEITGTIVSRMTLGAQALLQPHVLHV